jgi:hypothetical protein
MRAKVGPKEISVKRLRRGFRRNLISVGEKRNGATNSSPPQEADRFGEVDFPQTGTCAASANVEVVSSPLRQVIR